MAAWVATADPATPDDAAPDNAAPKGGRSDATAPAAGAAPATRGDAGAAAAAEAPDATAVRRPGTGSDKDSGTASREGSASASDSALPSGSGRATAGPAESAPGTGKRPGAAEASAPAVPKVADEPAPSTGKKPAPGTGTGSGDSDRTAVFRTVKPSGPASGPGSVSGSGSGSAGERSGSADDGERTAVFRTQKPAANAPHTPIDFFRPAKPVTGKPATPAGPAGSDAPADSERTAVFRAVKPPTAPTDRTDTGSASASGSGSGSAPAVDDGPADSESTAVFRVVKPAATGAGRVAPPKASTFVPLRTDDTPTPSAQARPQAPAPAPADTRPRSTAESPERTTQQPLPPRPPLDMLADLTNNPPPPPSPMRTAVRRFKIYFPLAVLLAIILAVVQLVRPLPEPKLAMTAKTSYTFDGAKPELPWPGEGQAYMAAAGLGTLGQSGEQKPVPIASVTKSMTAYIILRDHPIKKGEKGETITIDKTAETEGKKNNSTDNESTLDTVKEGDKISEYDAIAALMIPSANNIARLLARWDSGSQDAFVKKMNDTAKELGMANTTYTDPSGLDATTVSTAEDQVKLGLKLVEIETLLDITKKPGWVDPSGKNWRNWNGLVPYNDSLGIKTGTTTKAGGNLLFAAQKKIGNTNQLIVGAVLGQHKPPIIDSVLAASKQLMIATQKSLAGAPVVKKGDVVGYVDDGLGGRTPVVATADVQAIGWAGLTVGIKLSEGEGGKLPQTAKAGTEVGVLTVGEGASQVKVPVALQGDLAAPGFASKLTRVG
ncbi:hypothetical protein [Streptomyces subrutilus]|uniref:D-alanyl-D-alanine carboxypeptidase n=1 Tax=Streptomyces subrutilus TaxID=36818 RepID=UPI002E1184F4|nr:hypothetical protein OG479_15260 [Streptomyces subrutilus]